MVRREIHFADSHRDCRIPCVRELVRAIHAEQVHLMSVSEGVNSASLARIYSVRASIARNRGRAVAEDFEALAQACNQNADNSCHIWIFDGVPSYVVFELQPSREIAGCLRFEGSLREAERDAT
jgi:hypothetical protein